MDYSKIVIRNRKGRHE